MKSFLALVIVIGLSLLTVNTAFSLSPEQKKALQSGVRYFNIEADICGSALGGGLYEPRFPAGIDPNDLTQKIADYIQNTRPDSPLISLAADFVEYGQQYNVNPAFVVALAQKETSLGTTGNARPPQYNVFNVRNGSNGSFGSYPSYNAAIEKVNELLAGHLYLGEPSNFTTIEQIMNRYAPPTENATNAYVDFINDVMEKILGGSNVATSAVSNCGPGSGTVNADGYAFPVAPQTKSENGGVPGMSALPCQNTAGCHHDGTPAFDISRQPGGDKIVGTPVYAISDGEIDNLHTYKGIEGCFSLQLHSSKDQFWYAYIHLRNPLVKNGDVVKAGQQVAEIGERKCTGNGSDSHLHIDRGCIINGVPQKGGMDSCRDPGITPLINAIFESLPG